MEDWLSLPDHERQSLPFFEKNLATNMTHSAIAYWVAMDLQSCDLMTGNLYVIHMVLSGDEKDFGFLWPMRCLKNPDGSVIWHFPTPDDPSDKIFGEPNRTQAQCTKVVGRVFHVARDESPIDVGGMPGPCFH